MQKYVKTIGDERLTKVPADLDLKPYRDEHDYDLVKRMLACIARGEGPPGVSPPSTGPSPRWAPCWESRRAACSALRR
jgi:hypothetical protein